MGDCPLDRERTSDLVCQRVSRQRVGHLAGRVLGVRVDQKFVVDVVGVLVALAHVVEETRRPHHVEIRLRAVKRPLEPCRLDCDLRDPADVLDGGDLVDVPGVWNVLDVPPAAPFQAEHPRLPYPFSEVGIRDVGQFRNAVSDLSVVVGIWIETGISVGVEVGVGVAVGTAVGIGVRHATRLRMGRNIPSGVPVVIFATGARSVLAMAYHDVETISRDELCDLQDRRLQETVDRAYENVDFYRRKLDEAGVTPGDVRGVEDVTDLPFTTKEDFRDEYPDGLFAVDHEDVRRIHASSGTTGKPKIVAYTDADLELWREVMARSLYAAGVEPGETFQNAYGYGLFTGGMGFHDGIEELGATVIPTGGGDTAKQIEMLQALEVDAMGCTPSYCLYLAETAEDRGIDPREFPLSTVVIGAEPFTDPMREEIAAALDVDAIDIYGLSEIIGPGVSVECVEQQEGLHVWEDRFYPEVVEPQTGEPVAPGEEGELVLTTLTKEALPVLRYRTGDITRLYERPCDCGRTARRMDNVTGRTDDLLIVRGVNVYASQIEAVMLDIEAVAPHYRIDLWREDTLDRMAIQVEHHGDYDGDPETLHEEIERRLDDTLAIEPDDVEVVPPGTIGRTEVGKVKRVYDHP